MRAHRITPNLRVADIDAAKDFYRDFLGLRTEEFNLGWVARFTSPKPGRTYSSSPPTRRPPQMR